METVLSYNAEITLAITGACTRYRVKKKMFDFSLYEGYGDTVLPFEFLILKRARGYKFAAETTTTLNTEIRVAQFKSNRDDFSIHPDGMRGVFRRGTCVASKDDNNINARSTRPSSLEKKNRWRAALQRSSRTIPERTRAERVCADRPASFRPIDSPSLARQLCFPIDLRFPSRKETSL